MKQRYTFFLHFIIVLLSLHTFNYVYAQEAPTGRIAGKVVDKSGAGPLVGAVVQVENTKLGAVTDLDGKYLIKNVPVGAVNVVIKMLGYQQRKFNNVNVKAGGTAILNSELQEEGSTTEEVVIEAKTRQGTTNMLLMNQKNADQVSSGLSADLVRKTPDRTVADALKRVSGLSILDDKFVVVRGLSDRYNQGMINGALMPSSESDRKAFAMDIVPANAIENIVVSKTATPDLPGDFAGGVINIQTKDIPYENTTTVQVGGGYHAITTGQKFQESNVKSTTDWLGFDGGARQRPSGVLTLGQRDLSANRTNFTAFSEDMKKFNNDMNLNTFNALPNYNAQLNIGRRGTLFGNDFGVIASLGYRTTYRYTPFFTYGALSFSPGQAIDSYDSVNYERFKTTTQTMGLLNFSYKVGSLNKFTFRNLVTQTGENSLQDGIRFFRDSQSGNVYNERKRQMLYQSQFFYSSQFTGDHTLSESKYSPRIHYVLGYNNNSNDVPDFRFLTSRADPDPVTGGLQPYLFQPLNPDVDGLPNVFFFNQPGRFFGKLNEDTWSATIDVAQPFKIGDIESEVKVGGSHMTRNRRYATNPYNYFFVRNRNNSDLDTTLLRKDFGAIFQNENIKFDRTTGGLFQREVTNNRNDLFDEYRANSLYSAGYVMMTNKLPFNIKAIYGVRFESFGQRVYGISRVALPGQIEEVKTEREDVSVYNFDILPSINLNYQATEDIIVRGAYYRTVNRPEFRELSRTLFYDINTDRIILGNNQLVRTLIDNYDLKGEWFVTEGSLLSANLFYKRFQNPIELQDVVLENPTFRYRNALDANMTGVEFEARSNLAFLDNMFGTTQFANLVLFGNLTLIGSSVRTDTNKVFENRQMFGQSNWLLNLGAQYEYEPFGLDFTITYNSYAPRIVFVGATNNRTHIWENSRHILDFSVNKKFGDNINLRFTAGDILAQDLLWFQDFQDNGQWDGQRNDVYRFRYRNGATYSLALQVTF